MSQIPYHSSSADAHPGGGMLPNHVYALGCEAKIAAVAARAVLLSKPWKRAKRWYPWWMQVSGHNEQMPLEPKRSFE